MDLKGLFVDSSPERVVQRAQRLALKGRADQAIAVIEEAIKRLGESADLRIEQATQLLTLGKVRPAADALRSLMKSNAGATDRVVEFIGWARTRGGDIDPLHEVLAEGFIAELAAGYGRAPLTIAASAMEAMVEYPWPGNVRELRNTIERLVIMARDDRIARAALPPEIRGDSGGRTVPNDPDYRAFLEIAGSGTLREAREGFERLLIARRLAECGQNVSRAAEALGVERSNLHRKLKAYGLVPDRGDPEA